MPLSGKDRGTPRRQSDGGLLVSRGDKIPRPICLHAENVPAWIDNLVALKDVGRVNSSHQGDGAGRSDCKIGGHGVVPSVITLKPAIHYQFKTGQRDWPKT